MLLCIFLCSKVGSYNISRTPSSHHTAIMGGKKRRQKDAKKWAERLSNSLSIKITEYKPEGLHRPHTQPTQTTKRSVEAEHLMQARISQGRETYHRKRKTCSLPKPDDFQEQTKEAAECQFF